MDWCGKTLRTPDFLLPSLFGSILLCGFYFFPFARSPVRMSAMMLFWFKELIYQKNYNRSSFNLGRVASGGLAENDFADHRVKVHGGRTVKKRASRHNSGNYAFH